LASDQIWLWGRGYEGGGPQLELLRRLAHWMLKEPDLEEENLTATAVGQAVTFTRRTILDTPPGPLQITGPDGAVVPLELPQVGPGRFVAEWQAPSLGLYRPKEFEEAIASGAGLTPLVAASNGGIVRLEAGMPDIRQVREGRPAAGRGWIGIVPRGAYETGDIQVTEFLPAWLWLMLAALSAVAAWAVEGRRRA
jgi:hypothetical protein